MSPITYHISPLVAHPRADPDFDPFQPSGGADFKQPITKEELIHLLRTNNGTMPLAEIPAHFKVMNASGGSPPGEGSID